MKKVNCKTIVNKHYSPYSAEGESKATIKLTSKEVLISEPLFLDKNHTEKQSSGFLAASFVSYCSSDVLFSAYRLSSPVRIRT